MLLKVLFTVNLALFILHSMDAVRCREWKMFIILKELKEQSGYIIFTILHLPLFTLLYLLILGMPKHAFPIYLTIDILLIAHSIVHLLFSKHKANSFTGFSNILIHTPALLAALHMILLLLLT